MEIGQRFGQVVHRDEEEMLHRPRGGFDRRRGQGGLSMRRIDDTVNTGGLGGAQEGTEVLRVFERIEYQHEGRLMPFDRPGQDVVQAGELPSIRNEGYSLMAVEAGERGQRPAFDLDDRDSQIGGVQDQLLECLTALRNHQQPMGLAAGDECLLDGVPACHQFLVLIQQIAYRRLIGRRPSPGGRCRGNLTSWPTDEPTRAASIVGPWHSAAARPRFVASAADPGAEESRARRGPVRCPCRRPV